MQYSCLPMQQDKTCLPVGPYRLMLRLDAWKTDLYDTYHVCSCCPNLLKNVIKSLRQL